MSHYTIFIIKVGIVIILFIVFDYTCGYFLRKLYFTQQSGLLYRTTYSIETTKADILIFGSSRANHHYHPDIITESTRCSYYNVGRDGMGMLYNYAVLKSVLKRYKPKLIILDFTHDQFSKNNNEREKLSALLPYYNQHPEIKELILYRSPFERFKLFSSSYPFNSILPTILVGNMEINKSRKKDYYGYIPIPKCDSNELKDLSSIYTKEFSYGQDNQDDLLVHYFEEYIKTCVSQKLNLIVVVSPYLTKTNIPSPSIKTASAICSNYHVPFLDYSLQPNISYDSNNFIDALHLSEQGSKVFSKELFKNLKIQL